MFRRFSSGRSKLSLWNGPVRGTARRTSSRSCVRMRIVHALIDTIEQLASNSKPLDILGGATVYEADAERFAVMIRGLLRVYCTQ